MKKLLIGLTLLASMSSFASQTINHETCNVRTVGIEGGTLSHLEVKYILEKKGYNLNYKSSSAILNTSINLSDQERFFSDDNISGLTIVADAVDVSDTQCVGSALNCMFRGKTLKIGIVVDGTQKLYSDYDGTNKMNSLEDKVFDIRATLNELPSCVRTK